MRRQLYEAQARCCSLKQNVTQVLAHICHTQRPHGACEQLNIIQTGRGCEVWGWTSAPLGEQEQHTGTNNLQTAQRPSWSEPFSAKSLCEPLGYVSAKKRDITPDSGAVIRAKLYCKENRLSLRESASEKSPRTCKIAVNSASCNSLMMVHSPATNAPLGTVIHDVSSN